MKDFSCLVVGREANPLGMTVAQMIRRKFPGRYVRFVDNPNSARNGLEIFQYQIVVCDFRLGVKYTGVDFLLEVKNHQPKMKTILLVKNFCEDYPTIKLDTLELLRAVDCIWQVPVAIERVVTTIGGFLQAKRYPPNDALAYFRSRS